LLDQRHAFVAVRPARQKNGGVGLQDQAQPRDRKFYETGAGNLPIPKFLGLPAAWADEVIAKITRRRE
jgi:hypothetical protein